MNRHLASTRARSMSRVIWCWRSGFGKEKGKERVRVCRPMFVGKHTYNCMGQYLLAGAGNANECQVHLCVSVCVLMESIKRWQPMFSAIRYWYLCRTLRMRFGIRICILVNGSWQVTFPVKPLKMCIHCLEPAFYVHRPGIKYERTKNSIVCLKKLQSLTNIFKRENANGLAKLLR